MGRNSMLALVEDQFKTGNTPDLEPATERHYSTTEIAEILNVTTETVRRMLESEPGVIRIGLSKPKKAVKSRTTLRVPESVWKQIHRKLTVK